MKKILAVSLFVLVPVVASANCYNIQNYDSRNKCLALDNNDASYCYNIGDYDLRNYCLARVNRQSSYCYNIGDYDTKNECLAIVK